MTILITGASHTGIRFWLRRCLKNTDIRICRPIISTGLSFEEKEEHRVMVQTVTGIHSAMMRTSEKKRPKMDYKKELQEIIDMVEAAKNRLAKVTEAMDFDGLEVDSLDEALDAMDDAIDIMTDSLEEEK